MNPRFLVHRGSDPLEAREAAVRCEVVGFPKSALIGDLGRATVKERRPAADLGFRGRSFRCYGVEVSFVALVLEGVVPPRSCQLKLWCGKELVQSC